MRVALSGVRQRTWLLASIAALLFVVSGLWYLDSQGPPAPDIPFDQLTALEQNQFRRALSSGREHTLGGDLMGAWQYYEEAWVVHPWNRELLEAIDELMAVLRGQMAEDAAAINKPSLATTVELLSKHPYLAEHKDLIALERAISQ